MPKFGICATYKDANEVKHLRNDWKELPTVTCGCGQVFYREVVDQTQCRDCHSALGSGFYEKWKTEHEALGSAIEMLESIANRQCFDSEEYLRSLRRMREAYDREQELIDCDKFNIIVQPNRALRLSTKEHRE